jgi:allantoin racemase
MRILVINPNTCKEMTKHIELELRKIKRPDVELDVVNLERGPYTIESFYDVSIAVPEMLKIVEEANKKNYDAIVIACFADPGIDAARQLSKIPVIGIQETSMHIASMLGHKFSVITPLRHLIPTKERYAKIIGLKDKLASVRSLDIPIIEIEQRPEKTKSRILEVAKEAIERDGAEVIILGCAGMTGYAKELEKELKIPVIDPITVSLKIAEVIVDLGLTHSKIGIYKQPIT